jgi:hypothetical protein
VALVGTHRVLTGYYRNTVLVRQVFHGVVVWACHTVSCRVLHHLVCASGYLGVLDSTHTVLRRRSCPAECRVQVKRTAAVCYRATLCTEILRVRSADARSDGHARADQRRRHQPAHAHANGATDVVGTDLRADISRR